MRPFSAAQQPFSATIGSVICYLGGKNNTAKGKLQLKLKIHSFYQVFRQDRSSLEPLEEKIPKGVGLRKK